MPRDLHRKPFNDATLAKLELFQKHIKAWLGVFVGSGRVTKRKIRIFDLFCGPGTDSAGHKGTPILILEALQNLAAKIAEAGFQVEVFFNDADKNKIIELQESIEELGLGAGPWILHLSSKDFAEIFEDLRPQMLGSANLLLLDQNGVRFFTAGIFHEIRKLSMTDTLVFMSSSYVMRFKDEPEINKYLETNRIFVNQTPFHEVHRAIVDYYRSLVPKGEQYFLAPFSIRSGANIHGIIFGSRNLKGLEKFLEAAWSMDKIRGEADFDIDQEGIRTDQPSLFTGMDRPRKIAFFESVFESLVALGNFPDTAAVYKYVLQQGFLMKHATPVLKRLKQEGLIDGNFTGIGDPSLKSPQPITTF